MQIKHVHAKKYACTQKYIHTRNNLHARTNMCLFKICTWFIYMIYLHDLCTCFTWVICVSTHRHTQVCMAYTRFPWRDYLPLFWRVLEESRFRFYSGSVLWILTTLLYRVICMFRRTELLRRTRIGEYFLWPWGSWNSPRPKCFGILGTLQFSWAIRTCSGLRRDVDTISFWSKEKFKNDKFQKSYRKIMFWLNYGLT